MGAGRDTYGEKGKEVSQAMSLQSDHSCWKCDGVARCWWKKVQLEETRSLSLTFLFFAFLLTDRPNFRVPQSGIIEDNN